MDDRILRQSPSFGDPSIRQPWPGLACGSNSAYSMREGLTRGSFCGLHFECQTRPPRRRRLSTSSLDVYFMEREDPHNHCSEIHRSETLCRNNVEQFFGRLAVFLETNHYAYLFSFADDLGLIALQRKCPPRCGNFRRNFLAHHCRHRLDKTVLYARVSVRGVLHAGQLGLHDGVVTPYKTHQLFEIPAVRVADSICQFAFAMTSEFQTLQCETSRPLLRTSYKAGSLQ